MLKNCQAVQSNQLRTAHKYGYHMTEAMIQPKRDLKVPMRRTSMSAGYPNEPKELPAAAASAQRIRPSCLAAILGEGLEN